MQDFNDKVAVITGAASGIGSGLANRAASEGMRLVIADVNEAALAAMTKSLAESGARVLSRVCDVSRYDEVEALAQAAWEQYGQVDVLFNNAGVLISGFSWERSLEDWQWIMGVNFWGVLHGIKAFVPRMIEGGGEGHIVNTSSLAGLLAAPLMGPYTVGKQAVLAVMAQRLVRLLCHDCREAYTAEAAELQLLGCAEAESPTTLYRARGCEKCNYSGYRGRTGIYELIEIDDAMRSGIRASRIVPKIAPAFVQDVTAEMMAGRGDQLPVSAVPVDGTYPTATTQWEKRGIAQVIPEWIEDNCIQCGNCSFVCPHAAIRSKVYEPTALDGAPALFVVPRTATGVKAEPERNMGIRALPTAELSFEGVGLPSDARIGGEPGVAPVVGFAVTQHFQVAHETVRQYQGVGRSLRLRPVDFEVGNTAADSLDTADIDLGGPRAAGQHQEQAADRCANLHPCVTTPGKVLVITRNWRE